MRLCEIKARNELNRALWRGKWNMRGGSGPYVGRRVVVVHARPYEDLRGVAQLKSWWIIQYSQVQAKRWLLQARLGQAFAAKSRNEHGNFAYLISKLMRGEGPCSSST